LPHYLPRSFPFFPTSSGHSCIFYVLLVFKSSCFSFPFCECGRLGRFQEHTYLPMGSLPTDVKRLVIPLLPPRGHTRRTSFSLPSYRPAPAFFSLRCLPAYFFNPLSLLSLYICRYTVSFVRRYIFLLCILSRIATRIFRLKPSAESLFVESIEGINYFGVILLFLFSYFSKCCVFFFYARRLLHSCLLRAIPLSPRLQTAVPDSSLSTEPAFPSNCLALSDVSAPVFEGNLAIGLHYQLALLTDSLLSSPAPSVNAFCRLDCF